MDKLSEVEDMSARMKALEDIMEEGRYVASSGDREVIIEAPKPLVLKGTHDVQEVENFLCHIENYFKFNKMKRDEMKINITVLYIIEMATLWWKRKESKIGKGLCTISNESSSEMSSRKPSS